MRGWAQVAVPDQMDDQTAAQFYVLPCLTFSYCCLRHSDTRAVAADIVLRLVAAFFTHGMQRAHFLNFCGVFTDELSECRSTLSRSTA